MRQAPNLLLDPNDSGHQTVSDLYSKLELGNRLATSELAINPIP